MGCGIRHFLFSLVTSKNAMLCRTMGTMWTISLFILMSMLSFSIQINVIPDYFMQSGVLGHCGQTISGEEDAYIWSHVGAYKLGGIINYGSDVSCSIEFDAGDGNRVLVQVLKFDLEAQSAGGSCLDELKVYDSDSNDTLYTGCGSADVPPMNSTGQNVSLEFTTNENVTDNGFKVLVTSFRYETDNCSVAEYKCDSSRCIMEGLTCDTVKHCVDGSDEDRSAANCSLIDVIIGRVFGLGQYTVLAIALVVGGAIFATFASLLIYQCYCKNRKNRVQPMGASTATSGAGGGGQSGSIAARSVAAPSTSVKRTRRRTQDDDDLW